MPVLGMASENEVFNKAELKKRLTSMQYLVTQERGTERCVYISGFL
jgi:peptide methionine sulfoxide reductase MsrB